MNVEKVPVPQGLLDSSAFSRSSPSSGRRRISIPSQLLTRNAGSMQHDAFEKLARPRRMSDPTKISKTTPCKVASQLQERLGRREDWHRRRATLHGEITLGTVEDSHSIIKRCMKGV
jgi:hypothetical protein